MIEYADLEGKRNYFELIFSITQPRTVRSIIPIKFALVAMRENGKTVLMKYYALLLIVAIPFGCWCTLESTTSSSSSGSLFKLSFALRYFQFNPISFSSSFIVILRFFYSANTFSSIFRLYDGKYSKANDDNDNGENYEKCGACYFLNTWNTPIYNEESAQKQMETSFGCDTCTLSLILFVFLHFTTSNNSQLHHFAANIASNDAKIQPNFFR